MMVRTLMLVCCCCSTLASASSMTLQEILQEHAKTLGSEAYRDNIQNLAYEIKIKEPTFEATAIYQATRAGQMRIDLYMQGDRLFTEAFDGETAWQWNFGDSAYSSQYNPGPHTYMEPGTYNISLLTSTDFGCLHQISKEIYIKRHQTLYIPTSFTPNGDGQNDICYKRKD